MDPIEDFDIPTTFLRVAYARYKLSLHQAIIYYAHHVKGLGFKEIDHLLGLHAGAALNASKFSAFKVVTINTEELNEMEANEDDGDNS